MKRWIIQKVNLKIAFFRERWSWIPSSLHTKTNSRWIQHFTSIRKKSSVYCKNNFGSEESNTKPKSLKSKYLTIKNLKLSISKIPKPEQNDQQPLEKNVFNAYGKYELANQKGNTEAKTRKCRPHRSSERKLKHWSGENAGHRGWGPSQGLVPLRVAPTGDGLSQPMKRAAKQTARSRENPTSGAPQASF